MNTVSRLRLLSACLAGSLALLLASEIRADERETTEAPEKREREMGWKPLFDGKSLAGWTQRNGTATYRIEDGAIVGQTTEGSPNSFLCTDRLYDDFELEFEVWVDDRLNSGVQIRSQTRGGPTGRVNGPQVEIEASGENGAEAGYIYGEAAGGWMTPESALRPHKHFKDGEWNHYRVLAVGKNIKVWINDVLISNLDDEKKLETHPKGFIGLQVHGVGRGQGPFEVKWRKLRLREVSAATPLYNGKDLAGWKTTGNWLPQANGDLLIQPRPGEKGWQRYGDYLWTEKAWADFVLELEYSYPPGGNSGVFFRVADPANPVEQGMEIQILDSSEKEGEMTHHDHGGLIATQGASKNMSRAPGEWNHMTITCLGPLLVVELNGEQILDLRLDRSAAKDKPKKGHLGLQDHGEPNKIRFRAIRLREL